ncbi:MAG: DUF1819 family protein [Burkholderiales bacterium]|jgi:hypothetical protein|nr:DUF1819 family protein [Burkholderiales bacterium]MBP9768084.1 DUF1819 family protein [Burkholderiales bacterium]
MNYHYKANYLRAGLLLEETKIIANLLKDGNDFTQIKQQVEQNNLLNTKSQVTAKTYFSLIRSRLELVKPELCYLMADSDRELSSQAIFVAAIKYSPLVGDFLRLALRQRIKEFYTDCPYSVWDAYLEQCYTRDAEMAIFSPSSYNKLRSQTYNILIDGGFISDIKQKILRQPFFNQTLLQLLTAQDEKYILSCLDGMIW